MKVVKYHQSGPDNWAHDSGTWRNKAACQGYEATAFYPPVRPERRSAKLAREDLAKSVCSKCIVRQECLDQALSSGERYGIWGGLTDSERDHLRAS